MDTAENIFDSFTVYGKPELIVSDLAQYAESFKILPVKSYDGALDLLPLKNLDSNEVDEFRDRLNEDPNIDEYDTNYEEVWPLEPDPTDKQGILSWGAPRTDLEYDWHREHMDIQTVWDMTDGQTTKGEGIVIAHPDSGYIQHIELITDSSRIVYPADFIDGHNPEYVKASHGLATASVILGNKTGVISGIAPKAKLMPIRVARYKPLITPVLFGGGMRRLREAVHHAILNRADIISISLGGKAFESSYKCLRRILLKAKREDIITLAAAGNVVSDVVFPANDENVIAIAGTTHERKAWDTSSSGDAVVASAPAEHIWKADVEHGVYPSSGTSYAVANVAGVAALWLGHWGKDKLIRLFGRGGLVEAFKKMLVDSCTTDPLPAGYGAGIVNAKNLLKVRPEDYA